MRADQVRVWCAAEASAVLLMAGQTTHYAIEPRGEYVFGIVAGKPMRSRRGRERRLIGPGQLVAWDPSNPHAGAAVDGQPWTSHLIIVEAAELASLAGDEESALLADITFPEPALSDGELARDFLLPPHAFQVAHRIRKARRLLQAGETIADVAAATGFADQSHLHRHFQRGLGLTPGEYRRIFNPQARA